MAESKQPWQQRWREHKTGWDLQGEHPLTAEILDLAKLEGQLTSGAKALGATAVGMGMMRSFIRSRLSCTCK